MTTLSYKTRILNFFRQAFMNQPMEKLLIALCSGKAHDSLFFKLLPNNYQYPENSIREVKIHGYTFHLDIHNWNDWEVYFKAHGRETDQVFALCKPGDVVLDVGTNIGFYLLNFSLRVLPEGQVFGFEPHPVTYEKLRTNLGAAVNQNITISNIALGDATGFVEPYTVRESNLGMNRVKLTSEKNDNRVLLTTVDLFVAEKGLNKVDVIKIDVEGFEENVLRGAMQTIRMYRPIIHIEVDDENLQTQSSSPQAIIDLLNDGAYTLINATVNRELQLTDIHADCHFNLICRPQV